MKFNYDELTLENVIDNETNYDFKFDADNKTVEMILKEDNE